MTRTTNARLAGTAFVAYIAMGITTLMLSSRVIGDATDTVTKLSNMSQHRSTFQVIILLTLLMALCALVLAVTLYALTRDIDRDLAVMAMCCRVAEGIIAVVAPAQTLALLSITTGGADNSAQNAIGDLLFNIEGWSGTIAAICFCVGSTIYCWLFLRARSIPVLLAAFGVFASIILVVALPLMLAGLVEGLITKLIWLPMLVFELVFAFWLIIKGVAVPPTQKVL